MSQAQECSAKPGEIEPGMRRKYVTSGNAIVTIVGKSSRFTFHIVRNSKQHSKATHWVAVLRGPDNGNDFEFMGGITDSEFYVSPKSRFFTDAPSAVAFAWFWKHPEDARLTVLHSGHCGRCGRLLTTPESIRTGLGPVCAQLGGGA